MTADEIELDWMATLDADVAFLAAQQNDETQAECVRAAVRAYLARRVNDLEADAR